LAVPGALFFAYVRGNVKKGLKVTKNPYKIFVVGCGRRDGVWGVLFEGGGIILVPAILLGALYIVIFLVMSLSLSFSELSWVGLVLDLVD